MNLLDLLFPRRCVECGKWGSYFCKTCISRIEYITHPICPTCSKQAIGGATHPRCKTPQGLDGMYAMAHYRGPLRNAIHLLKYRFVSDLAASLVSLLTAHYPIGLPTFDLLTPVPLHPKREKQRGFNQSLLLSQILGKKLHLSVERKLLVRTRFTQPQYNLKVKDRLKNVEKAFTIKYGIEARGKSIGLVDDLATTRCTLFECTKVLKRAGAKTVWAIVLAHG